jgi:Chaperone of endosialidase
MKTTTLQLRNLMNRSPLRAFFLIAVALGWLALSPQARAVCQEGCLNNDNTVLGEDALISNTTGFQNTANGAFALADNTDGSYNTANGVFALHNITTGNNNIAVGSNAGGLLFAGSHNIYIGNTGVRVESGAIRIGTTTGTSTKTFIAGISGVTVAGGVGVIIDTNGRLGTVVSSERFKDNIKPMDKASETILALKPVIFHYKEEIDPDGIPQFGLVAEEVEKVNPDLVVRDDDGKPYTVRYEAVNAMLLNEFLKARRQIDAQQKQIDALTAGLQKVSAQIEISRPAPQTVVDNH